jgi:hypothetical protein
MNYPGWLPGCPPQLDESSKTHKNISFPPLGTILILDPDLPGQGRRMTLEVSGPDGLE